jgi:hypothetical protein
MAISFEEIAMDTPNCSHVEQFAIWTIPKTGNILKPPDASLRVGASAESYQGILGFAIAAVPAGLTFRRASRPTSKSFPN